MSDVVVELIEKAYERLAETSGFERRASQLQLSLLLHDLILGKASGAFEAPTGLGKSLACLIPAIANAIVNDKRVVIATYTNVLAEQYWRKDLPQALALFDEPVTISILFGRPRYACLVEMDRVLSGQTSDALKAHFEEGTESEFRRFRGTAKRDSAQVWSQISVPPACPARACPAYHDCYLFSARRRAQSAKVVITNHSVVISHACSIAGKEDEDGLLGKVDFIILDEAHDFFSAAQNGLEIEVSPASIRRLQNVLMRLDAAISAPLASKSRELSQKWKAIVDWAREHLEAAGHQLGSKGAAFDNPGILLANPSSLESHPAVLHSKSPASLEEVQTFTNAIANVAGTISSEGQELIESLDRNSRELARSYLLHFAEFKSASDLLFSRDGVSVSFLASGPSENKVRKDLVDLGGPLQDLIWSKFPTASVSATLVLDGEFDYYSRSVGLRPDFTEILPSPFDFRTQAAVYLPKLDRIPDPTAARRDGTEANYFSAMARELTEIIEACEGRTLALFHSRREMEAVHGLVTRLTDRPVYIQPRTGAAAVGERFKAAPETSLFALRSFWTGFDAPGDTLSCVAIVRLPFEVPVEAVAIARSAYFVEQGLDPFREHTLAGTKLLIRQGAGRLIRSTSDKGIIAMLDPRLRTKRYGEEILTNLPGEMRVFDDIADAVGWIGLDQLS
jgi:ATP-dependent DNA helicase DinG